MLTIFSAHTETTAKHDFSINDLSSQVHEGARRRANLVIQFHISCLMSKQTRFDKYKKRNNSGSSKSFSTSILPAPVNRPLNQFRWNHEIPLIANQDAQKKEFGWSYSATQRLLPFACFILPASSFFASLFSFEKGELINKKNLFLEKYETEQIKDDGRSQRSRESSSKQKNFPPQSPLEKV